MVMTGVGGVNKLEYRSVDNPVPKKDEALVKVLYCGINHLDLLIRLGKRSGPKQFPHILGSEIAGELSSGEIVAVYPWIFCGKCEQCKSGNEQMCNSGGTVGRNAWGGYAEYVAVPKRNLITISKQIAQKASAIILAGTTAHHLVRRGNIQDKATVLVTGATGGVGTLVIQLLKLKKCTVICATSHEKKISLLRKLGADRVVLVERMVEEVNYAIDLVGGDTWSKAVQTLGKNGTFTFCSTSKEEIGRLDIGNAFAKQLNILGSTGGNREDLQAVLQLVQKGVIKPVINAVFSLEDAKKAHERMEKQEVFGKMLLKV